MRCDVVKPNKVFWQILAAAHKSTPEKMSAELAKRHILALDPGETTGCAHWRYTEEGGFQIELFQWETKIIGQAFDKLIEFLVLESPDHVRYEEYRIYNWMADTHSWANLHTAQWIGAIQAACHLRNIPCSKKLAQQAKAFWTDEKLEMCGLYAKGQKHARDALRHLLYMLTFPGQED